MRGVIMREIAQVEEFHLRGMKAVEKVQSIIKAETAREIIVEGESGEAILRFVPDKSFLNQTLNVLRGTIKVIKTCKLAVTNNQMLLFN